MTVKVGGLTVRREIDHQRKPSGLIYPRVFRGDGVRDYTDRQQMLWEGRDIHREGRCLVVRGVPYETPTETPDQVSAEEHCRACQELDRTQAGQTARELLLGYLAPSQRRTASLYHFFDVGAYNKELAQVCLDYGWPVRLSTVRFRIKRGYPNGNVLMAPPGEGWRYTLCLHPISPYPTDDICLGQLSLLRSDPEAFIQTANITDRHHRGYLTKFPRLFKQYEHYRRSQLVLPLVRDCPVPENIVLGEN